MIYTNAEMTDILYRLFPLNSTGRIYAKTGHPDTVLPPDFRTEPFVSIDVENHSDENEFHIDEKLGVMSFVTGNDKRAIWVAVPFDSFIFISTSAGNYIFGDTCEYSYVNTAVRVTQEVGFN